MINSKNHNARKIDDSNIEEFMKMVSEEEIESEVNLESFTPADKLYFVDILLSEENVRL